MIISTLAAIAAINKINTTRAIFLAVVLPAEQLVVLPLHPQQQLFPACTDVPLQQAFLTVLLLAAKTAGALYVLTASKQNSIINIKHKFDILFTFIGPFYLI